MSLTYKFQAETIIKEGRTTRAKIEEIKNLLQTTSLPEIPDELICLFLLSCRNEINVTYETIKAYFRIRKGAPEIFSERDIDREELKKAMRVVICTSLPARMPGNIAVHFCRTTDTDYRNYDMIACMKLTSMIMDVTQMYNPPTETILVMDMKGVGVKHLTCVKIGALRKFIEYVQEGMPFRIQRIHVLNASFVFDKALAIAKVFMKGELMQLIMAHPPQMTMEEFQAKWIPASCLPREYDGELPGVEELNQISIQQFRDLKEFYDAEEALMGSYHPE